MALAIAVSYRKHPRFDTRTKYEDWSRESTGASNLEGVFYVTDPHSLACHQYTDDIEPVALFWPTMPVDPDVGGLRQLLLLPPVDSLHRLSEPRAPPSLHLDEHDRPFSFDDEIDIPVPRTKSTLQNAPTGALQPSLRDSLSELSERLPGR